MLSRPTLTEVDGAWPQRAAATSSAHGESMRAQARELRKDMSLPEVLLWKRLRRGQLLGLRFRRQHVLGPYVADFYCHHLKLVVEVDGAFHDAQRVRDAVRDEWMKSHAMDVLRISAQCVLDSEDRALECIKQEAMRIDPTLRQVKGKKDL